MVPQVAPGTDWRPPEDNRTRSDVRDLDVTLETHSQQREPPSGSEVRSRSDGGMEGQGRIAGPTDISARSEKREKEGEEGQESLSEPVPEDRGQIEIVPEDEEMMPDAQSVVEEGREDEEFEFDPEVEPMNIDTVVPGVAEETSEDVDMETEEVSDAGFDTRERTTSGYSLRTRIPLSRKLLD